MAGRPARRGRLRARSVQAVVIAVGATALGTTPAYAACYVNCTPPAPVTEQGQPTGPAPEVPSVPAPVPPAPSGPSVPGAGPSRPTIIAGAESVVLGHPAVVYGNADSGSTIQLLARDNRPAAASRATPALARASEYRVVRTFVVGPIGRYAFVVYPTANTRFATRSHKNGQSADSVSTFINLRPRHTMQAVAAAQPPRTFTFTGRVRLVPVGTPVNLYAVTRGGGRVLLAKTRTGQDGHWRIVRTFQGTDTVFVFARTVQTPITSGGTSKVQRIVLKR